MHPGSPDPRCTVCGIQNIILFEKLFSAKQKNRMHIRYARISDAQNTFKYNFILEKRFTEKQNAYQIRTDLGCTARGIQNIILFEKLFSAKQKNSSQNADQIGPDLRCTARGIQYKIILSSKS